MPTQTEAIDTAWTPTPEITDAERAAFARDGVVCIRGALPRAVAEDLCRIYDTAMAGVTNLRDRVRVPDAFAPYILNDRIPALVGRLVGATSVGFYWKQMFEKPIGSTFRTPWHHDAAGWPLKGPHIIGAWIALTPVVPANGLECLAGSHRWPDLYWAETANGRAMPPPPDRPRCPDFEERRADPSLKFLGWTMNPGDALFIHPRTLHFSCGNRTQTQRRLALATWWHGDDLAWDPRPECEPFPAGVDADSVRPGERPFGDGIPILWRAPAP